MFVFAMPIFIILFVILGLIIYFKAKKRPLQESGVIFLPTLPIILESCGFCSDKKGIFIFGLKIFVLSLLILALMQPQLLNSKSIITGKGVDIILALDISGSMQALDFGKQDRLSVAKKEAERFINGRKGDRIGLVVFAAKTFLQCPLTLDYQMLKAFIEQVRVGQIQDGTAIGSAIATALRHLKHSKAKTKLVILITDGVNNAGNVDPITAANLAKELGVKIYAIGVGKEGVAPFPVDDPIFGRRIVYQKTEIDEKLLKELSSMTGGSYFRAQDEASMKKIFKLIDSLEKSDVKAVSFSQRRELFRFFLAPAILLVIVVVFLEDLLFASLP